MTIKIEIKGIEEVKRFLKEKNIEKLQKADEGVKQAGWFIQGEVVESVAGHRAEIRSVDTGRFMGSIKAIFDKPLTASVETNVSYAKHLEYGTSKLQPRSHFRNTVARNESKIREFIKEKIKE